MASWLLCLLLALGVSPSFVGATSAAIAKVLVVYHTETNYTRTLAQAIADGATGAGGEVRTMAVADADFERDVLGWADALVIGSPTHYGNPSATLLGWVEVSKAGRWGRLFAGGGGILGGVGGWGWGRGYGYL